MITAHTDTVKVSRSDSGWPSPVSHVHYLWAVLIARIYEILPLISQQACYLNGLIPAIWAR